MEKKDQTFWIWHGFHLMGNLKILWKCWQKICQMEFYNDCQLSNKKMQNLKTEAALRRCS